MVPCFVTLTDLYMRCTVCQR